MASFNTSTIHPTSSNSFSPAPQCTNSEDTTLNIALSNLFLLVFPCALVLNGIAFWISLHLKSTSTFIVYLKNLVAADFLITLSLPLMAASSQPGITVGLRVFTCRYSDVVFYCLLYTSIILMGLISLDRFFKIVKLCGKSVGKNVVFSKVMSYFVWFLLFGGTCFPSMILTSQTPPANMSKDCCMELKSPDGLILHGYVVATMQTVFWFMCSLIVFCYIFITVKVFRNSGSNNSQGKKKTKLRVFLVLLVFFVCFVPLHVMRRSFTLQEVYEVRVCTQVWLKLVYTLSLWLTTTNACLDPLLYIFLCRKYKNKLADMMKVRGISLGWCIEEKGNSPQQKHMFSEIQKRESCL